MKRRQYFRFEDGSYLSYNTKYMRDHPTKKKEFLAKAREKAKDKPFFSSKANHMVAF